MNLSEAKRTNQDELLQLRRLVRQGEGLSLEFKRRASSPDQIVREMIAFANTSGGILLIGVNDDGDLSGVKYPEEESLVVRQALKKFCRPFLFFRESIIALPGNKYIVQYEVPQSRRRPHIFKAGRKENTAYIRVKDMSMKASAEMTEVVRLGKLQRNTQFTYGPHEAALMQFLANNKTITLTEFQNLGALDRNAAAKKLITLVLAGVLKITPTERGDFYSRIAG